MDKQISVSAAAKLIKNNSTIMIGGFLRCGSPTKVIDELIIYIIENNLLAEGGYIVCEYPKEDVVQKHYDGFKVKLCRRYSSSEVLILEKE